MRMPESSEDHLLAMMLGLQQSFNDKDAPILQVINVHISPRGAGLDETQGMMTSLTHFYPMGSGWSKPLPVKDKNAPFLPYKAGLVETQERAICTS